MVQNWEVIVMKGESEPWWFFPKWREDITEIYTFSDKESAIERYKKIYHELHRTYHFTKVKNTSLAAFWNEGETAFCAHCDDDLQLYIGLLILADGLPYEFKNTDPIDLDSINVSTKREIK